MSRLFGARGWNCLPSEGEKRSTAILNEVGDEAKGAVPAVVGQLNFNRGTNGQNFKLTRYRAF